MAHWLGPIRSQLSFLTSTYILWKLHPRQKRVLEFSGTHLSKPYDYYSVDAIVDYLWG